jgi:predicted AlkP superfamily phosphohydrolase/phosphomutase
LDIYHGLDQALGEIMRRFNFEDSLVMIVSDHGFGPINKAIYVNSILEQRGYLKTSQASQNPLGRIALSLGLDSRSVISLLLRFDFLSLHRWIVGDLRSRIRSSIEGSLTPKIDWNRTVAYAHTHSSWGIFVNMKGRNPSGIVEPDEYEKIRDAVINDLSSLRDPENGQLVFRTVARRENVYRGKYVEKAPDIIAMPADGYIFLASFGRKPVCRQPEGLIEATHRREGILVVAGGCIKQNAGIIQANLVDIVPTVLFALGCPIPDDLDGRVLSEIFTEEILTRFQPKYTDVAQLEVGGNGHLYSTETDEAILDRLRGLGYID